MNDVKKIAALNAFHQERATYWLHKFNSLPEWAVNRKLNAQYRCEYHTAQMALLLVEVTGTPAQMILFP
jgi:hypothetical protein